MQKDFLGYIKITNLQYLWRYSLITIVKFVWAVLMESKQAFDLMGFVIS